MTTKTYFSPELEVVQMFVEQTILSGSTISSNQEGSLDLTLNGFGDETAW